MISYGCLNAVCHLFDEYFDICPIIIVDQRIIQISGHIRARGELLTETQHDMLLRTMQSGIRSYLALYILLLFTYIYANFYLILHQIKIPSISSKMQYLLLLIKSKVDAGANAENILQRITTRSFLYLPILLSIERAEYDLSTPCCLII
jgi:hypothetical protein